MRFAITTKTIALFLSLSLIGIATLAQDRTQSGKTKSDEFTIRVDTTLVNVPVAVLSREGNFIPNLRRENFQLFEDGVAQEITHFKNIDEPFTVALLLDISDSAKIKLQEIKSAAMAFLNELRPQDKAFILTFDAHVEMICGATNDITRLKKAINQIEAGGGTSVYDAVDRTYNQEFKKIQGRKAIVMFTDGVDIHSKKATADSTLSLAEEQDAPVYVVRYDTYIEEIRIPIPGARSMSSTVIREGLSKKEYDQARLYLQAISDASGGRYFFATKPEQVKLFFARIAEELRQQYVIGYYPTNLSPSKQRRQIKVKVDLPNTTIRTRKHYVYQSR